MLQKDATCKWYLLYVAKVAVGSPQSIQIYEGKPYYPSLSKNLWQC